MDWAPSLLLLCALWVSFTWAAATNPKHHSQGVKGKRKGPARAKALLPETQAPGPDPMLKGNAMTSTAASPYTLLEDYERSIQEMVSQLWNSSEPADNTCQVNLRLWRSNKRSLSPWAYSINHDATRIPADIPEAQCLCAGCINPFTMQEDRTIVSIPIYSKLPVRRLLCHPPEGSGAKPRRKKKRCHKEYKMVMETIAVGCTCIF